MNIPSLFRCPISLDLFTDPVTLSTGQTYDRPCIEKWLTEGNLTCPVTMQRLDDTSLVPNHTLRHLINQWLLSSSPSVNLVQFSVSTLKHNLQSQETDAETKIESLQKVRIISVESDTGQASLIELGFFRLLLQLLFQSPLTVNSQRFAELAVECVISLLPSSDMKYLKIVGNESSLNQLVVLLEQGNGSIQSGLCTVIESISSSVKTQEVCLFLGQSRRLLQVLLSLIHQNSESSVRAICGICSLEANRENVVISGGIEGLIAYLSNSGMRRNSPRVLATLEVLLELEIAKKVVLRNSSVIDVLVKNVFRVSMDEEGSEHAVGSLLSVCGSSARARAEAAGRGVVMQLLLLIQSQCSEEAKEKARALLKLFRFMWIEE